MVFLLASCALDETPLADSTEVPPTDTTPTDSPIPQEIEHEEYTPIDREELIQAFRDLDLHHEDDLSIIFDVLGTVPDSGYGTYNSYHYETTDLSYVRIRSLDGRVVSARFHDNGGGGVNLISLVSWQMDFDEYTPISKDELVQTFKDLDLQDGDDVRLIFSVLGTVPNRGSGMSYYYHYENTDGTYVLVTTASRTIYDVRLVCEDEGFAFVDMMALYKDPSDATE